MTGSHRLGDGLGEGRGRQRARGVVEHDRPRPRAHRAASSGIGVHGDRQAVDEPPGGHLGLGVDEQHDTVDRPGCAQGTNSPEHDRNAEQWSEYVRAPSPPDR